MTARESGTNRQTAPLLVLAAVTALLLAGGWALWAQEARRGSEKPAYSVLRTDERGAALVYRLYQRMGLRPKIWDRDFTHLSHPGLLILIAPAQPGTLTRGGAGEMLPFEIEALDSWVKRGGVAVVMSRQENPLFRALGLIVDEPETGAAAPAEPAQPAVLADHVEALNTESQLGFKYGRKKDPMLQKMGLPEPPEPITAIPAGEWVELFVKRAPPRSLPQVVAAARGAGLYLAVNDVFPAANLGLVQGDNARFMLNLARLVPPGASIWFDEYHKRAVERGLVAYVRERSLAPALVYLALLAGLVFWRLGVPFGAPQPLVADRRRDSMEYVRATASLYQSAGMAREALAVIHEDFIRRTRRGQGAGALPAQQVARRYAERTGSPPDEALAAMDAAESALTSARLSEGEVVRIAAALAQVDAALHPSASGATGGNTEHE